MKDFVIFNGALILKEKVLVSPLNRGMMYGDGFFETFRAYEGKFLLLEKHFERIASTADFLGIEIHFRFDDFKSKILELLEANKQLSQDVIVRVQCWRKGERGYFTTSSSSDWITSSSVISPVKGTQKLSLANTRSIPSSSLERKFKLSNGLNYIAAAREVLSSDANDAIMLTVDGKISETTSANIFWVSGSKVCTPAISCDLLPGITRNLVIELIKNDLEVKVEQERFDFEGLRNAEAVFTTNSVKELQVIESIDETAFSTNHEILDLIKKSFLNYKLQNLK